MCVLNIMVLVKYMLGGCVLHIRVAYPCYMSCCVL